MKFLNGLLLPSTSFKVLYAYWLFCVHWVIFNNRRYFRFLTFMNKGDKILLLRLAYVYGLLTSLVLSMKLLISLNNGKRGRTRMRLWFNQYLKPVPNTFFVTYNIHGEWRLFKCIIWRCTFHLNSIDPFIHIIMTLIS